MMTASTYYGNPRRYPCPASACPHCYGRKGHKGRTEEPCPAPGSRLGSGYKAVTTRCLPRGVYNAMSRNASRPCVPAAWVIAHWMAF